LREVCGKAGVSMRKVAISLGLAAVWAGFGFLCAPPFLAERAGSATRLLLAAGLFTIAIAAVVRK
jgi:biotin carboxylase